MTAKTGPVRRTARAYGQSAVGSPLGDGETSEKSDAARRAILDATTACFAEFGWSGTNMSVIARRSRMTRGRIQYYFPTLDDLLRAAIDHLMVEWRKRYFSLISEAAGPSARVEAGIEVLWNLMKDPLHVAKQELEASARTNPELRALLQRSSVADDEASVASAKQAYPELATQGDAAFRRARNFTMVFMEGLAIFRFSTDPEGSRREMIEMLTSVLMTYWNALGVEDLAAPAQRPPAATSQPADEARTRALELIQEAARLLAATPG